MNEIDDDVKVVVENSHITGCEHGIKMEAHGQLEVRGSTITARAANFESEDGIYTGNRYDTTISVDVRGSTISGFNDCAIEIAGPSTTIDIKDSDLRDCDWGIWVEESAKNITIIDTVIYNMDDYGLDFYSEKKIEMIQLQNLVVCDSGDVDISFYNIGEVIDDVKVVGNVYCDSAIEYDYHGPCDHRNMTTEICTETCANVSGERKHE